MQVYTGHLVAVVRHHYQAVNVLKFTDDGTYLLSGGADARVLVWKFSRLILKILHNWNWKFVTGSPIITLHPCCYLHIRVSMCSCCIYRSLTKYGPLWIVRPSPSCSWMIIVLCSSLTRPSKHLHMQSIEISHRHGYYCMWHAPFWVCTNGTKMVSYNEPSNQMHWESIFRQFEASLKQ